MSFMNLVFIKLFIQIYSNIEYKSFLTWNLTYSKNNLWISENAIFIDLNLKTGMEIFLKFLLYIWFL